MRIIVPNNFSPQPQRMDAAALLPENGAMRKSGFDETWLFGILGVMKVGEKVVCIDAKFPLGIDKFYVALPVEGQVYVIRDMIDGGTWSGEPEIAVYLVGIQNPKSDKPPYFERGFSIKRFRPLDEVQGRATREESKEKEAFAV